MKFVKINSNFSPEQNFWELNPQLIYISPFSQAYNLDGGKDYSSKLMWSVYFVSDPDEEENKFYRFGREKTEKILSETYFPEMDWTHEVYINCLREYPNICMTAVQRSLKMKIDSLVKRGIFLNEQDYNLETMAKIDLAHSKTTKIMEDYETIYKRFFDHKSEARVKGGRKQSKSEKREV